MKKSKIYIRRSPACLLGNGDFAGCGLGLLGKVEFQDAVFQRDLDVFGIDVVGQAEAAFVSELFVLAGTCRLDGQDVLFDLDVQIFFLDARNFDFESETAFGFVVVSLRRVSAFALCVCGVQAVNEVLDTVESVRKNLCVHHNFNLFFVAGSSFALALFCSRTTISEKRAKFFENDECCRKFFCRTIKNGEICSK